MSSSVTPPDLLRCRLHRAFFRSCGRIFAFGPLFVVLAFGAFWIRSYSVQERLIWKRSVGQVYPDAKQASLTKTLILPESGYGVGGLVWSYDDWKLSEVPEAFVTGFEKEHAFGRADAFGTTLEWKRLESDPRETTYGANRLFGRRFFEDVGSWKTFHWVYYSDLSDEPIGGGGHGPRRIVCGEFAAPYWLLMAPLFLPLVWWLWCPTGRAIPRLTLRRLGMVTLGVALACSTFLMFFRASAYDRALSTIYYLGGNCLYDWSTGRNLIHEVSIVREVGPNGFDDEAGIRLGRALAALPGVPDITIKSKTLTSAGLAWLVDQPDLEELWLAGTKVDDRTLAYLDGHKKIREIGVSTTRVTDAGLVHLRGMTNLDELFLEDLPITDAGLAQLEGLPSLRTVILTDRGLNHLTLDRNRISKAAVDRLFRTTPKLQLLMLPNGKRMSRDGEMPISQIYAPTP